MAATQASRESGFVLCGDPWDTYSFLPRLVIAQEGKTPFQSFSFEYTKIQVDFGKAMLAHGQRDGFVARG